MLPGSAKIRQLSSGLAPIMHDVIYTKYHDKRIIEFYELDPRDQDWCLKETYRDNCKNVDLGLNEPILFKENGKTFIEGKRTMRFIGPRQ